MESGHRHHLSGLKGSLLLFTFKAAASEWLRASLGIFNFQLFCSYTEAHAKMSAEKACLLQSFALQKTMLCCLAVFLEGFFLVRDDALGRQVGKIIMSDRKKSFMLRERGLVTSTCDVKTMSNLWRMEGARHERARKSETFRCAGILGSGASTLCGQVDCAHCTATPGL